MSSQKIIFIAGPTAVGKTDVSIILSQKLDGEIISCDAMQVYRQISIASSKPSKKILSLIPHHLVNVVSVEDTFDVAAYYKLAVEAVKNIFQRGKIPIIVGGSGLYVQVLLDGIFKDSPGDLNIRTALKETADKKGLPFLVQRLKNADPEAAAKIHPNDARRIIRALEVFEFKKEPISKLQKARQGLWGKHDIFVFVLNQRRDLLYNRINNRVDRMFEEGIVEEVKKISELRLSKTVKALIGIKEILGYLNKEYSLERTKELIKLSTRHLAKKQLTWFRKEKRSQWILIEENESQQSTADKILRKVSASH